LKCSESPEYFETHASGAVIGMMMKQSGIGLPVFDYASESASAKKKGGQRDNASRIWPADAIRAGRASSIMPGVPDALTWPAGSDGRQQVCCGGLALDGGSIG
jgi:hypothetical protein